MKRLIALTLIVLSINSASAKVVNVNLDDMLQIGIEHNNDIKIKRLELDAAAKDIKIANKLQNPEFQSNIIMGNVALGNSSQAGLVLPIEVMKRGVRKRAAIEQYNIKETELKQFEHNYKLQIMKAYFDVLYAKSVYKIQQDRLKLFEQLVQITTDRPQDSQSYEIDNLKADIQFATQKIEVNRAKAELLAKQFELNKLLNTGDDSVMYDTAEATLLADWAFLNIKLPEYDFIERVALKFSYMIRISDFNVKKSQEELKLAKRNRIPDVNLAGGYAWQAHSNAPNNYGGAFVGFGMDVPVLYNYTPDIQKAEIFLQKSKANKRVYEYQLKFALKTDYNIFKYSAENMEYSKQILEDSKRIVKLSTENYISGKNTYSDLVINENAHQDILASYLNAMSRHFYSYLELMQDIGHDILIEDELL
ncbi:MAG: TolC family protein [Candidatus Gastranaerophilales bacterium]|nr:TolC family protein [Candidatus Gastranaerophilales bacterium]MCM1072524.1 TolC family protein [Bacteroides sp.]